MNDITEKAIWAFINEHYWLYWSSIAFLAAANLAVTLSLASPRTRLGRASRVSALVGFFFIAFSVANTGMVPIGLPFIFLAFLGINFQFWMQCRAKPAVPSTARPRGFVERLAASLVETH